MLVLRIHHPERANALTGAMLRRLTSLLEPPALADVHAVLLCGAGERHFSAGLDLAGVPVDRLVDHLNEGARLLFEASEAIVACRRPVVALVNGACFGGGLELAMACDWRICLGAARLGMPAARLGVVYAPAGLRRAVELMGAARARRMFVTGRPMSGEEAFALGLVDELADDHDDLWHRGLRAGEDIGACSPVAVAGIRAIIRAIEAETAGGGGPEVEEVAACWRAAADGGPHPRGGVRAFAEGRPAEHRLDDETT